MMPLSFNRFMILYMWFPLAVLLIFLFLIARFFDKFSGERTYARLFLVPILLFGVGTVRYASLERTTADIVASLMFGSGGLLLIGLSLRLYWLMIVRRQQKESSSSDERLTE
jgi:hypothetical protein